MAAMNERRSYSVAIYPRYRGRALLIHHQRLGVWLPPGGECEPGETPLLAAQRELYEETGLHGHFPQLSPIAGTPPGLIGYEEHQAGGKGLHMNFVFVADVDTEAVRPNAEFSEWRWLRDSDPLDGPRNVGQLLHVALGAVHPGVAWASAGVMPPLLLGRRFFAALSTHDLDALMALYAAQATHRPGTRPARPDGEDHLLRGREVLRSFWAGELARLSALSLHHITLTADAARVVIEYAQERPGEAAHLLCTVLEVQDEQVQASRTYHAF